MQSPMDFESMSFGTRTLCRCAAEGTPASTRPCPTRPGTTRTPARPPAETDRRRQNGFAQSDAQNLTPAPGRRNRSSTSMRLFLIRCAKSFSRAHSPKPAPDAKKTESRNPRFRILLPRQLAEADRRRQNGIAQSEAGNPSPAPTRRDRSSTSMRNSTIRCSELCPRARSPGPIIDSDAGSRKPMLEFLLPCSCADTDCQSRSGIAQSDAQNPTPAPARRGRSSKSKRNRALRRSESYRRADSPKPIVESKAAPRSPMLRILFLRPFPVADRRRQDGIAQSAAQNHTPASTRRGRRRRQKNGIARPDARNLIPVPIRRDRSSMPIRNRAIRRPESCPRWPASARGERGGKPAV